MLSAPIENHQEFCLSRALTRNFSLDPAGVPKPRLSFLPGDTGSLRG
jgi:hypothetical protein